MKYLPAVVSGVLVLGVAGLLLPVFRDEGRVAPPANGSMPTSAAPDIPAADAAGNVDAVVQPLHLRGRDATERITITSARDPGNAVETRNLYKWRQDSGTIVISSYPPRGTVAYETFGLSNPSATEVPEMPRVPPQVDAAGPDTSRPAVNPLRVYTPEGLRELIRYSRSIGAKVEIRDTELSELIELL